MLPSLAVEGYYALVIKDLRLLVNGTIYLSSTNKDISPEYS